MDPSLYEHVRSAVGEVSGRASPVPEGELLTDVASGIATFTRGVSELLHWCRLNENMILDQPLSDAKVYVGFEQVSRTRGVAARYGRICEVAAEVHVFGEPDAQAAFTPTSFRAVHSGPLLREWFLVIASERYKALLSAVELGQGPASRVGSRKLDGILCYHPRVVESACELLADLAV